MFKSLLNAEIPDFSPAFVRRWGWLERLGLVGFAIVFPLVFVLNMPGIFLGFGLGDAFPLDMVIGFFRALQADHPILFPAGLALLVFHLGFRMRAFLRGQLHYRTNDPELPARTLLLFILANSLNIVFVALVSALVAILGAMTLGLDFTQGLLFVDSMKAWAEAKAMQVPTLIHLPSLLALFVVYTLQGFFHYWIHRLCHLNRVLWLVLHRFHHMPPTLTLATTTVVIASVPFFMFIVIPKVYIFAAVSKLFHAEPLYMEIFFMHLIMWIGEPYAHQTALYQEGRRNPWIRWIGQFSSTGIYHYMHHAADDAIVQSNKTNQVNISGGFFFFWDRLFGTYHPLTDDTPQAGLWQRPALHHNPIRLLLSGLLQVAYELRHNRDWRTRFWCLFGSVSYCPPISRDFHRSEHRPATEPYAATPTP